MKISTVGIEDQACRRLETIPGVGPITPSVIVATIYSKHEDACTVGLGIYANARISENVFRREWNQTPRTYYARLCPAGQCGGLTSAIKPRT